MRPLCPFDLTQMTRFKCLMTLVFTQRTRQATFCDFFFFFFFFFLPSDPQYYISVSRKQILLNSRV